MLNLLNPYKLTANDEGLEKYDKRIEVEESEYPTLGSLIIHSENEYKTAILQMLEDTILLKSESN